MGFGAKLLIFGLQPTLKGRRGLFW